MKKICSYILAIIVAINSSGCATTQPLITESTPVPYENAAEMQVNDEGNNQSDEIVDSVLGLFLIGAVVVLGVGIMTCCDISLSSN